MSGSRYFPRLEGEDREKAIAEAGPSWRQWFFFSFARVWGILAFFIGDVFVIGTFGEPFVAWALFPGLAAALYGEYVLYQYLWHRPALDDRRGTRGAFHPTWHHPFEVGRWTVEGERVRAGLPAVAPGLEPQVDPDEFL